MKFQEDEKPCNFTLVIYEEGSNRRVKAERLETRSKRRFLRRLRLLPDKFDGYLRVSYGGGYWNDGFYGLEWGRGFSNGRDYLLWVFEQFCEG